MVRFILLIAFLLGFFFSDYFTSYVYADCFFREELLKILIENDIYKTEIDSIQKPCNQCASNIEDYVFVNTSASEEKNNQKINDYFEKANIAVSATCEQVEKVCNIKK